MEACFRSAALTGMFSGGDCFDHDRGYFSQGVAQGGLVDRLDGSWYACLFQDMGAVGRLPIFVPVTFQDDWPVFGEIPAVFETSATAVQPLVAADNFKQQFSTPFGFKPQWQFNHVPRLEYVKYDQNQGEVTLISTGPTTFLTAPNMLTVRTAFPRSVAEITVNGVGLARGDVCGLCLFQGAYRYLGLKREKTGLTLIAVKYVDKEEVVTERVSFEGHELILKAVVVTENMLDYVQFFYQYEGVEKPIGFKEPLTFTLDHFTGARFGLFLFSEAVSEGRAVFKTFKYESVK